MRHHEFDPYSIKTSKEPGKYRYRVYKDGQLLKSFRTYRDAVRYIVR